MFLLAKIPTSLKIHSKIKQKILQSSDDEKGDSYIYGICSAPFNDSLFACGFSPASIKLINYKTQQISSHYISANPNAKAIKIVCFEIENCNLGQSESFNIKSNNSTYIYLEQIEHWIMGEEQNRVFYEYFLKILEIQNPSKLV